MAACTGEARPDSVGVTAPEERKGVAREGGSAMLSSVFDLGAAARVRVSVCVRVHARGGGEGAGPASGRQTTRQPEKKKKKGGAD